MMIIPSKKSIIDHQPCGYCELAHVCLPKGLSPIELNVINDLIEQDCLLKAGSVIAGPLEAFEYLYAVRSGSFKEYSIDSQGEERIIDFYLPGDIIGLGAISRRQYGYPIIALEASVVCRIAFTRLLDQSRVYPDLQSRLLNLVSEKLHDRAIMNNHQLAEQRLAAFLINMSKRFAYLGYSATCYPLSMSRYEIGNYLNLTTETVSHIFTKFKNQGLISINKKKMILNKTCDLMALIN